jgi:hypothetical protein
MTMPGLQAGMAMHQKTPVRVHRDTHMVYRPHEPVMAHMRESVTDLQVHCSLVAVDITAFGDLRRNDMVQRHMRRAMYDMLEDAFNRSGVCWQCCFRQDRGDGVLIVVPSAVPIAVLIDPLAELVEAGLRKHNELSSDVAQIRLRMALHAGHILFDDKGVVGHNLTLLFDLLDAHVFKSEFAETTGELGLITSEYVYDDVIRHCPGRLDPADYEPIEVVDDTRRNRAWVRFPPGPNGRSLSRIPRMRPAPAPVKELRDVTRAAR